MLDGPVLTVEEFLDVRFELPESGQWSELIAGRPVHLQPPDVDYGNTVLNLSKQIAGYIQNQGPGYACFDLGLLMETNPDTVRFPAMSYFLTGTRFSQTDLSYTAQVPEIVTEIVSTTDRRQTMTRRAQDYLAWGVQVVWLIDPHAQQLESLSQIGINQLFQAADSLKQQHLLPGFSCPVASLFEVPGWWIA